MINMKAYQDVNGEVVYVEEGSFQELDSIAAGLTPVPALDYTISADRLNNVTLDAKLDDSQLIDDDTMATATSTNIPSALSIKNYVDNQIDGVNEASEIAYDPSSSTLTDTNVQDAIDSTDVKVEANAGNITTNTTNIGTNTTDIAELELNQADLITLTGVPENSTDMGTFPGTVIGDNVQIKTALTQLESAINNTRVSDVTVVADIPARDALTGMDEGDVAIVLDDGTGRRHSYIYDGAAWQDLKTGDFVSSVNTQTGDVVLDTDDVLEGSTNLYHTVARARAAAVVNSTAGSETDQAASVDAMKTYVAGELANQDEASEISYDNSTSGLVATDVQGAIDEVEGRVDTLESATHVNSFNGRTGVVVPVASDYDADQVDFDNSTNGFTATDVQAAIEEVQTSMTKEYIYGNQTIAQNGINATAVNLIFDNEAIQSAGTAYSLNTTTGEITINKASVFKVDYRFTADTQDGARRTGETFIEVDTGSGFAEISAALGSSRAYTYNRNNASGENTASAQAILDLAVGDVIRVRVRRSNGSGLIRTVPSGTSISIEEK